jgi:hypothetical protein
LWSRVGTGSGGATIAALGFAAGATLMARWPLYAVDRWLTSAERTLELPRAAPELLGISTWIGVGASLALIAAVLVAMGRRPDATATHWPWPVTGLALGAVGVLAWVTGALSGWGWGLSVTGPARSLVEAVFLGQLQSANWGTAMLVGIPIGTWMSARARGPVSWRMPPSTEALRRFGGGLLMGMGGTLAAGCNVGNALTGLSILAVNSILATAAMFVGGAVAIRIGRSGSSGSGLAIPVGSNTRRTSCTPCVVTIALKEVQRPNGA